MKAVAAAWLVLVVVAGAYLGFRIQQGIGFQTDLMALLPQAERDPDLRHAKDQVARSLGQRIVLLIGHDDRDQARAAGAQMAQVLAASGLVDSVTSAVPSDGLRRLGQKIFFSRHGLLADGDRQRLQNGKELEIVTRALSQVYGPVGMADAGLLKRDPFLLLPAYFANLPLPLSRVTADEGVLSVRDGGRTYVFISARLAGEVFSLRDQDRFAAFLDQVEERLRSQVEGLDILRIGAVFYAREAARQALDESSAIGVLSIVGTVLLIWIVFGALRPLWLSVLVIAVGVLCALAASLWLFGELHVAALLFGTSLIGISVDYSLHFCAERFSADARSARERLRRVMAGLVLGLTTTLIGYVTLLLTNFPGLHQLAVFSAIGVSASFITVVAWLPELDRDGALRRPERLLRALEHLLAFWQEPRRGRQRLALFVLLLVIAIGGFTRFEADDDVRRLQSLSAELRRQELAIHRLTGISGGTQFMLVQARDTQAALQTEERLMPLLEAAKRNGAISGYQAAAQFVPSIARQTENRNLVQDRLHPLVSGYYEQLGMVDSTAAPTEDEGFVTTSLLRGRHAPELRAESHPGRKRRRRGASRAADRGVAAGGSPAHRRRYGGSEFRRQDRRLDPIAGHVSSASAGAGGPIGIADAAADAMALRPIRGAPGDAASDCRGGIDACADRAVRRYIHMLQRARVGVGAGDRLRLRRVLP